MITYAQHSRHSRRSHRVAAMCGIFVCILTAVSGPFISRCDAAGGLPCAEAAIPFIPASPDDCCGWPLAPGGDGDGMSLACTGSHDCCQLGGFAQLLISSIRVEECLGAVAAGHPLIDPDAADLHEPLRATHAAPGHHLRSIFTTVLRI